MSGKKELLRVKGSEIERAVTKFTTRRDVMIHAAFTILPQAQGITVIGAKEQEVQFACEWPANKTPIPERYVRQGFKEMEEMLVMRMRLAGVIK